MPHSAEPGMNHDLTWSNKSPDIIQQIYHPDDRNSKNMISRLLYNNIITHISMEQPTFANIGVDSNGF